VRLIFVLAALLGSTVLVLCGCTTFSLESGSPLPDLPETYRPGAVTYKQVMADMGPPHRVTPVAGGFAFLYEYAQLDEGQFTITLATLYSPFVEIPEDEWAIGTTVGPTISKVAGKTDVAVLTFDDTGALRGARVGRRDADMGTQRGFTWLLNPQSVSNMPLMRETKPEMRWGMQKLRRMPIQLNELQDPTAGPYGFQQTGTPWRAGQRSNTQLVPLTSREQKLLKKGKLRTR
jgi:hypothetical protein